MKLKAIFLTISLAASLFAASIEEGDRFLKAKDYKNALAQYEEVYYSTQNPPRMRYAAGLKRVVALREMGFYEMAENSAHLIGKDKNALPEERIKAWYLYIELHIKYLNNSHEANHGALELISIKGLTPEQKKFAQHISDEHKRRKNTMILTPEEKNHIVPLKKKIRPDHPRLFFNKETLPLVIKHNQRPDIRGYYERYVLKRAKDAPDNPKLWTGEKGQAKGENAIFKMVERPNFYGTEAAACALVYLIDGDKSYRDKAIRLLEICAQAVDETYRVGVLANGEYYGRTYLYSLCAWDWLYHEMTPEQRQRIGKELLKYAGFMERDGARFRGYWTRPENTGFYCLRMYKWFAALTFTGENIDEEMADKLLYEGYRDHEIVLQSRDVTTGDDGGIVCTSNNYTMATHLWSTYNYLASWESAIGEDRAPEVKHLLYFPQWCVWSLINGTERQWTRFGKTVTVYLHDFGNGDTDNTTKEAFAADLYLYEILHFYPDNKQVRDMVLGCITKDPMYPPHWPYLQFRPLTPVIRYKLPPLPEKFGRPEITLKDHARYFENLGIVFMRSGSTATDTYAAFVTGKQGPQHRHFDANSFSIYKHDFLALDTGTRIGSATVKEYEHLNTYYAQSVAHNTILIHKPKELLPDHWWFILDRTKFFNHGGQNRTYGDRTLAYETNDLFTYIAGDAAPTFAPDKCKLAMRQFVFVYPDIFVIADRVISTQPDYRKEWIIHSQNEPELLDGSTFRFDDGGGRLFCKTLLPAAFRRTVVGGPGKEFFASGKNWELPKQAEYIMDSKNYVGRYRVEVAPQADNASELFLHVIQVGADTMPKMVPAKLVENADSFGTEFETDQGKWQITFAKSGAAAGHVKLTENGKTKIDRPLRKDIQPQAGLQ